MKKPEEFVKADGCEEEKEEMKSSGVELSDEELSDLSGGKTYYEKKIVPVKNYDELFEQLEKETSK